MLKGMINSVVGIVVAFVMLVVPAGVAGTIETHYTREGVVIAIEGSDVVVCDTTDNEWVFEGEGYIEGDKVSMLMFNAYTDNTIYDDEIVRVKIVK